MLRVQTICRLGQDATINVVNGKSVINFSAAYSEKYRNADGAEVNQTTWMNCSYWIDKTGIAQYLKKGTQIFMEGKPEVRMYTNAQAQQIPQLVIRVSSIRLVGSSQDSAVSAPVSSDAGSQQSTPVNNLPPVSADDLPF